MFEYVNAQLLNPCFVISKRTSVSIVNCLRLRFYEKGICGKILQNTIRIQCNK